MHAVSTNQIADILHFNNKKIIRAAYKSKYNNKRKKQVILLMITNGKKQHYLAVLTYLHYLKEYHQIMMKIFIV